MPDRAAAAGAALAAIAEVAGAIVLAAGAIVLAAGATAPVLALGVAGVGVAERCAPTLRPPPKRFASASSAATSAVAAMTVSVTVSSRFMVISVM